MLPRGKLKINKANPNKILMTVVNVLSEYRNGTINKAIDKIGWQFFIRFL